MNNEPVTILDVPAHRRRKRLARRAQLLAGASVSYNLIEGVIAVAAGMVATSSALISFGLDSAVEVASGLIILWQFRHPMPESREHRARRLIAVLFFALAVYVAYESIATLVAGHHADVSVVGILLACVSVVVMPLLSWAQRRTGRELSSGAVVADSAQTLLCTYLSAVLLVGLLGNALFGWWWLDPIAALAIAAVAVREGIETWRGDDC
jgi:divalent metal cation (Fe/Co/Zn/Cd) transporter